MPEGDSYTRAADSIRPVLLGQVIDHIDGVPAVRRRARRLVGSTVTDIRTRGKHLLLDTSTDLTIHVALGMPGRVRARRGVPRTAVRAGGAVRLAVTTSAGTVTVESAPTVEVERPAVIDSALERLGPDVLAPDFDWPTYRYRAGRAPDDMLACDFLLDQRVMAGVGNEYKNEILFLERIHPLTEMRQIDADDRDRLAERARRLMIPNAHRPTRSTTGRRGPGAEVWVYGRAGKPCRRCRTAVAEAFMGLKQPRITFWCPHCQTLPADNTG